jgi:hypothetical protein
VQGGWCASASHGELSVVLSGVRVGSPFQLLSRSVGRVLSSPAVLVALAGVVLMWFFSLSPSMFLSLALCLSVSVVSLCRPNTKTAADCGPLQAGRESRRIGVLQRRW